MTTMEIVIYAYMIVFPATTIGVVWWIHQQDKKGK